MKSKSKNGKASKFPISNKPQTRSFSCGVRAYTKADGEKIKRLISVSSDMAERLLRTVLVLGGDDYCLVELVDGERREVVHHAEQEFLAMCQQHGVPQEQIPAVRDVGRRFYKDFVAKGESSRAHAVGVLKATKRGKAFSDFRIAEGVQIRNLKPSDLPKIMDGKLKAVLSEHLAANGNNWDKAFQDADNMPAYTDANGEQITFKSRVALADQKATNRDYSILRQYGIFPTDDAAGDLAYAVCASVKASLSSYEEKRTLYAANQVAWNEKMASHPNQDVLARYVEFLRAVGGLGMSSGAGNIRKWTANHFKRFILAWIDKDNSLRSFLLLKLATSKQYLFTKEDEHFGYQAPVLQVIFDQFRDLWEQTDVIGNHDMIRLICGGVPGINEDGDADGEHRDGGGLYHWQKDYVNIPTPSAYKKFGKLLLGKNMVNYQIAFPTASVEGRNGDWVLTVDNPLLPGDKIVLKVFGGGYMNHLKVLPSTAEFNWKNGVYQVEFSKTSSNKTRYYATIKEPSLRWLGGDMLRLDIPTSKCRVISVNGHEVNLLDSAMLAERQAIRNYFVSSSKTDVKRNKQEEHFANLPSSFVALGMDAGLNPVAKFSVAKVHKGEHGLRYEIVAEDSLIENDNVKEECQWMNDIRKMILAAKKLADYTLSILTGKESEIPAVFVGKSSGFVLEWQKLLGVSRDDYMRNIAGLQWDRSSQTPILEQLWHVRNDWEMKRIARKIAGEMKLVRGGFGLAASSGGSEAARLYAANHRIDLSVYTKYELVRTYISFNRKFHGRGEDVCRTWNDYLQGLRRHINSLSSAMLSVARDWRDKLGVEHVVLFMENLDANTSAFSSREQNKSKTLWSTGDLIKLIGEQADMTGVVVVDVDPSMTSQMDSQTQQMGWRDKGSKRDLYVERNGVIEIVDADANASRNILIRGLEQHRNLNDFSADMIAPGVYRVGGIKKGGNKVRPIGVRRMGSLYSKTGSTSVLFKLAADGELVIWKTNLTPEEKTVDAICDTSYKYPRVICNGGKWYLQKTLSEMVESFPTRHAIQESSKQTDARESEAGDYQRAAIGQMADSSVGAGI